MAKGKLTLKRKNAMGGYSARSTFGKYAGPWAASIIQRTWRKARGRVALKARSGTMDMVKSLHQRAEQDGIGGSFTEYCYGTWQLKLPASVISTLAKNFRVYNTSQRQETSVGTQDMFTVGSFFGAADMLNVLTEFSASKSRALFLGVRAEAMITNAANTTARVTIYDIVARRDINSSSIGSPAFAWKQGEQDEGGSATNYKTIGCTPFSSKSFTELYEVKKVSHVLLAQGATHVHRTSFFPRKVMDYATVQYGNQFKGLTGFTMVVQHGQSSNDVTTKASVSVGATDLNVVYWKEYETCVLKGSETTVNFGGTTIPTSFAVGENTISLGAGIPTAYADA